MKITGVETFILHVPVTREGISDSTHSISHWGVPGVIISTDDGIHGFGYSGTHGHLPTDKLITSCIEETYAPLLMGEDPSSVQHLWRKLCYYPPVQWVGRGGITHLALGAIDIALWDIKSKAAEMPLWKLLGGAGNKEIAAYNTDGGWLNWDNDTLVADCRKLVEDDGFLGIKIKVGSPHLSRDLNRIELVRDAIGPRVALMVDANGRPDLPSAIQLGTRLSDYDIVFFEEPTWYDDIAGHRRLADAIDTPIALGEQLYLLDHFRSFVDAGAVHYVQPDVVRLGGITEWWQAADLALAHRLPVVPHIGDMMQVHLQCCIAHPACATLEYIPWLRECFEEPVTVQNSVFLPPLNPGAGTTLREDARSRFGVA